VPSRPVTIPHRKTSEIVSAVDVLLPVVETFTTAAFAIVLVLFTLIRCEAISTRLIGSDKREPIRWLESSDYCNHFLCFDERSGTAAWGWMYTVPNQAG